MATHAERSEVQRLLDDEAAQLVEVLPRHEYEEEHLEGAVSIPLKELDETTAGQLDARRPVVVYCWDRLCDMSPRAGRQLERLGFDWVYDYVAGKVDWMAAGRPTVRADTGERRALDVADRSVATCRPEAPVEDLPAEADVLVLDEDGVVLGRVREGERQPGATAADVMRPGPSTVRAHEPLDPLLERMKQHDVAEMTVTTPEGQLLGVVRR